jgi:hypothetical protein
MTEYEIADLAASSVFELQGQVSLFQTAVSMISDIVQQYMGILFGYIVAAYFIGASLGRRQVWVFTSLYVMWHDLDDGGHCFKGLSCGAITR